MTPEENPESCWLISGRTLSVTVRAENWLVALGYALEAHADMPDPDRLACEKLGNGSFIVNDLCNGRRYHVQPTEP